MTVSFTYNKTKQIAQRLIVFSMINEIWLQAKQLTVDDKVAIVINGSNRDFHEIDIESSGIIGYMRDVREAVVEDAGTDACNLESWVTQTVRLVFIKEETNYNGNELSKLILQALSGVEIVGIFFDAFQIIQEELPDSLIAPSPDSFIFAVEFNVRELIQLHDCITEISCDIETMKVC